LLQAGIPEFHLGLDACRTADAEVIGVLREIAKQSRLPDPGLPSKYKNAGPAFSSALKESGEPPLFLAPSEEFMVSGIEAEGVAVYQRGIWDITASHGSSPPPAARADSNGTPHPP
jgi:hypothetical protein